MQETPKPPEVAEMIPVKDPTISKAHSTVNHGSQPSEPQRVESVKEPGLAKSISFSTREERLKLSKLFAQPEPAQVKEADSGHEMKAEAQPIPEMKEEVKEAPAAEVEAEPILTGSSVESFPKPKPLV